MIIMLQTLQTTFCSPLPPWHRNSSAKDLPWSFLTWGESHQNPPLSQSMSNISITSIKSLLWTMEVPQVVRPRTDSLNSPVVLPAIPLESIGYPVALLRVSDRDLVHQLGWLEPGSPNVHKWYLTVPIEKTQVIRQTCVTHCQELVKWWWNEAYRNASCWCVVTAPPCVLLWPAIRQGYTSPRGVAM